MYPLRILAGLGLTCVLLTADSGLAQSIPAVGTDATLDVATWNIEWFGDLENGPSNDERQLGNVRAVIEQSGIDLWAVQEIADETDWNRLLQELGPGYEGQLATQSGSQRIGFIYRTDVIEAAGARHILEEFSAAFAGRPPLQMAATITLPDTTVQVTFITVHMKAFGDRDSYEQRAEASRRLKSRLDFNHNNDAIIVLGDFNDELSRSTYLNNPSPYANFIQDASNYAFVTYRLDQENIGTWCGGDGQCQTGSTIDHILISDQLFPAYVESSADRYEELLSASTAYVDSTSDHLPVYAQFRFNTGTPVEAETPARTFMLETFPNPFQDILYVRYALLRPAHVTITLFDVLGRAVASQAFSDRSSGEHVTDLAVGALPSGTYLLRLEAGTATLSRQVIRVP